MPLFISNRQGAEIGRQARLRTVCPQGMGVRFSPLALGLILFLILILFPSPALAQDFTFDRSYSDYIYTLDQYRIAHQEYDLKKTEYLKFNTLTSQTAAQAATLDMLLTRDNAIRTHLTALRLKLAATSGVNPIGREALYSRIDQEVNWLFQHQVRLKNTASIAEAVRISKELEDRYTTVNLLMYQALSTVLSAKENSLTSQSQDYYQQLSAKVAHMKQAGETTQLLERWLLQANQRLDLSAERQSAANLAASKFTAQSRNLPADFLSLQFTLKQSHQYLKEVASSLQEIIREITK